MISRPLQDMSQRDDKQSPVIWVVLGTGDIFRSFFKILDSNGGSLIGLITQEKQNSIFSPDSHHAMLG